MNDKALIVISLNVDSEKEVEFNDFYCRLYIMDKLRFVLRNVSILSINDLI